MAQTTWVIEGQEIEQQVQGGKEFKDVLAQLIPGIDVSSPGRTNYGMNMRGRAIVVLIDGVRLNSSRTDSRQRRRHRSIQHRTYRSDLRSDLRCTAGGSTGGLINIGYQRGSRIVRSILRWAARAVLRTATIVMSRVAAAVSGGTDHASGRLSVAYQRFRRLVRRQ